MKFNSLISSENISFLFFAFYEVNAANDINEKKE